jgi:probable HAF family extracellular repeat protein
MSQPTYTFYNIGLGEPENFVTGISGNGQIVGYAYSDGRDFVYSNGSYTTFSALGGVPAVNVTNGINDQGQIVGSSPALGPYPGFLYSEGTFTSFRDPGSSSLPLGATNPIGINDAGQIVGISSHSLIGFLTFDGFLYSSGNFTPLNDPVAAPHTTNPNGINDSGQIVGYYLDNGGVAHGFLDSGGNYTTLDDPLATAGTYLTGINNTGQIVGYYKDGGQQHGFLYNDGTFTTLDNPLGVGGTELTGIDNSGQIVGNYLDGGGHVHGFLGTMAPPPLPPPFSAATAATNVYANEHGSAPTPTELDVLIAFTTPQYAYGQQIGVMDPAVYAYQSLGAALASTAPQFQNHWGPSTTTFPPGVIVGTPRYPNSPAGDAQFVADAYANVFGDPGSSAQVQHFIDQLNFFEGIYTASGAFGSAENVDLLARGAIYGQMLGIQAELIQVPLIGVSAASDVTHGASHS